MRGMVEQRNVMAASLPPCGRGWREASGEGTARFCEPKDADNLGIPAPHGETSGKHAGLLRRKRGLTPLPPSGHPLPQGEREAANEAAPMPMGGLGEKAGLGIRYPAPHRYDLQSSS